jgi:heme exporter protein D
MDTLLLGITVVSLIVALVMSVTAWRVMRDEKHRSAARIAALAAAASDNVLDDPFPEAPLMTEKSKAPWAPAAVASYDSFESADPADSIPLRMPREKSETGVSHAADYFGAVTEGRTGGGGQRSLALAAVALFVVLSGGLVWMMSGPEGTTAVAVGPNSPLELVSLSHARQNDKLAVSGLVRNPASGQPVEKLSAVVFLFDRMGTFVTSSRAHVDFLKLGAGDESPFVVSIDAPATVSRYRVSFRTDDGVVPHIDRRGESPAPMAGERPIAVTAR